MDFKQLNEALGSFRDLRDRIAVSKDTNDDGDFQEVYDIGGGFYLKLVGYENSYGEEEVIGAQIVKPVEIKVTQFQPVN